MNKPDNAWAPRIDASSRLVGPYPEVIDLRNQDYDFWKSVTDDVGEFSSHPLKHVEQVRIENDEAVRAIYLTSPTFVEYMLISNLPNLEEINFNGIDAKSPVGIKWIKIHNLPKLKSVKLRGNMVSVEVIDTPSLENLNARGCADLAALSTNGCSSKISIQVQGCRKLREIEGLNKATRFSSRVENQIEENQKRSKHTCRLYDRMTFTDIDEVIDLINEGVKALSRCGVLYGINSSILGKYGLSALSQQFRPYAIQTLKPLQPLHKEVRIQITHENGQVKASQVLDGDEFMSFTYITLHDEQELEAYWSMEDAIDAIIDQTASECLEWSSHSEQFSRRDRNRFLSYLEDKIKTDPDKFILPHPIQISPEIRGKKRELLIESLEIAGMRSSPTDEDHCIFVCSDKCSQESMSFVPDNAVRVIRYSEVMYDLKGIRELIEQGVLSRSTCAQGLNALTFGLVRQSSK